MSYCVYPDEGRNKLCFKIISKNFFIKILRGHLETPFYTHGICIHKI
jgi:hypothetical protein